MNPLVSQYVERLRPCLKSLGLEDVQAQVEGGRLLLTFTPAAVLPVRLEVATASPQGRYFKSNPLVGVSHGRLPDPQARPPKLLEALADLLLKLATADLVKGLGPPRTRDPRLWNLDLASLVAKGLKPAAILNIENRPELLNAVVSKVPAAALSDYPYFRNSLDQLKWITEAERQQGVVGHRLVYCAQDQATAQLLRKLDWELYGPLAHTPEQQARIGVILGYPQCCASAYEREPTDETEAEDIRWARSYVRAAERRWAEEERTAVSAGLPAPSTPRRFSPWTNFLAARMSHMSFFEHLPCTPWCQATEENNRRIASALFGPQSESWLMSLLSVSFFCWSDARMVPFRCGPAAGEHFEIRELGTAWTEGVIDRYLQRLSDGSGLLPADPSDITALRRHNGQWEVGAHGHWLPLGVGKQAPMVLIY